MTESYEPEEIIDYIYAVLHSTQYRTKYVEFLKADFPRLPVPKNDSLYKALARLGEQVRGAHLMTYEHLNDNKTIYSVTGSDAVDKISFADQKVWINSEQYFDNVPADVWSFYIGGYQPAQKWLKDRRGRTLSTDDIVYYQNIVTAIKATIRIMGEIDEVIEAHGGWSAAFVNDHQH